MRNILLARAAFWLFAALLFSVSADAAEPFVHTVTPENLSGHMTRLDQAKLNGQPEKLLLVTPVLGADNPHTVGVWYEQETGQWTIYNEDRTELPVGAMFNVIALDPTTPNSFIHTTTEDNTIDYYTTISHSTSDYNSNAKLLITPNWTDTYVPGPLGVWYDGEHWSIYRQDKEPLDPGVRFNVLVVKEGKSDVAGMDPFVVDAETHRVGFANTRNHVSELQNLDPDALIFLTHNWGEKGPYNVGNPAVSYNGSHWTITNQGDADLQHGALFNTFIFSPSMAPAQKVGPVDKRMGWLKITNAGPFATRFTLIYMLDGSRHIASSGTMQPKSTKEFKVPMRATGLQLKGDITDGKTVVSPVDLTFEEMPNRAYQIGGSLRMPLWSDVAATQGAK